MSCSRVLVTCAASALLISGLPLAAGDFSSYRGFQFGAPAAAVTKHAGLKATDLRTVHQRPALIQELEWRPISAYSSSPARVDPVSEALLRFANGTLFQIVVTYDRQKVEGLSAADMVDVISSTYGESVKTTGEIPYRSNYGDTAPILARWENPDFAYTLVRTGDQSSYAMVMSKKRETAAAEAAEVAARKADLLDAPQRAIDLQKKQDDDARTLLEKARLLNKPNFRP